MVKKDQQRRKKYYYYFLIDKSFVYLGRYASVHSNKWCESFEAYSQFNSRSYFGDKWQFDTFYSKLNFVIFSIRRTWNSLNFIVGIISPLRSMYFNFLLQLQMIQFNPLPWMYVQFNFLKNDYEIKFLPNFFKLLNQLFIFEKCESHMCHAKDWSSLSKAQQFLDKGAFQWMVAL